MAKHDLWSFRELISVVQLEKRKGRGGQALSTFSRRILTPERSSQKGSKQNDSTTKGFADYELRFFLIPLDSCVVYVTLGFRQWLRRIVGVLVRMIAILPE